MTGLKVPNKQLTNHSAVVQNLGKDFENEVTGTSMTYLVLIFTEHVISVHIIMVLICSYISLLGFIKNQKKFFSGFSVSVEKSVECDPF